MNKIEIVSNQAIEADIIEILERAGYGEAFTYQKSVYGRGGCGRREGSAVWPESNVFFTVFLDNGGSDIIMDDIKKLKMKFPREGIKGWLTECDAKSF